MKDYFNESERLTMSNAAVSTPTTTNINIRIDTSVKQEAETLFDKLGFSMSGAINVFFRQAIREQAIPFPIKARTEAEEKYIEYFNPHNMRILTESLSQIERGETISFTLAELQAMETGDIPQKAIDFLKAGSSV